MYLWVLATSELNATVIRHWININVNLNDSEEKICFISAFHFSVLVLLYPGAASVRAIANDPIRGLIAEMTNEPKTIVPAPLVQKESTTGYSYQQINCLDSIIRFVLKNSTSHCLLSSHITSFFFFFDSSDIVLCLCRYLESCNIPNTVKRKCGSSSCTSDDDKQETGGHRGTSL